MREIPVRGVERYRDGGTTYVRTDEGVLFSPTAIQKEAKPSWGEQEVKRLDPNNFDITDNEAGVTLSPKS